MTTTTSPRAVGETAHTPTPWIRGPYAASSIFANLPDSPGNPIMIADTKNRNHAANAAFIVRACNGHAALVEALEQTRAELAKFSVEANYPHTVGPWLARIDAALDSAKGSRDTTT